MIILDATLGTLYKEYFSFDKGSELPLGWQIAPFSKIATVIMGQSPEGDDCNNDGIGEPLLNGPTELVFIRLLLLNGQQTEKNTVKMEIFYSAFVVQQPEEWIGQTSAM